MAHSMKAAWIGFREGNMAGRRSGCRYCCFCSHVSTLPCSRPLPSMLRFPANVQCVHKLNKEVPKLVDIIYIHHPRSLSLICPNQDGITYISALTYFRGLLLHIYEARMYVAELAIDLAAAADNNAGGRPRLSARPVQGPFLPSTRPLLPSSSAFQIPSEATHSRNGAIAAAQNCKMLLPLTKECWFRQI